MADSREIRQQELARLLLQKARQDLALVRNVGDSEAVADEIIGFHVQQAVAKALKSVLLVWASSMNSLTIWHYFISKSRALASAWPSSLEAVEVLTAFAVQFRYMLYEEEPGFDRRAGARLAEEIEWAHGVIEKPVQTQEDS